MRINYDPGRPGVIRVSGNREELKTLHHVPGYNYVSRDPYQLAGPNAGQPVFPASAKVAEYLQEEYLAELSTTAQFWLEQAQWEGRRAGLIASTPSPRIDYPELRPYQVCGVNFLREFQRTLLADQMGTGKTVQALFAVEELVRRGCRVLVLTVKSLIPQWIQETHRWLGTDFPILSLAKSDKRKIKYSQLKAFTGICYMNHEALPTLTDPQGVEWDWVIVDEAHLYKNRKAQRTQALFRLSRVTQYLTLMTGTPLEKAPHDLWALLHALYPEQFSSYWAFFNTFVDFRIEFTGIDIRGAKNTELLHDILRPFYLRRLRTEVLPEVHEPVIQTVPLEMDRLHRHFYDEVEEASYIETIDLEIPNAIARLTRLRQLVVDPRLLEPAHTPGIKIDAIQDLVAETDEHIVIFTTFRDGVKYIAEALGLEAAVYLSGTSDPETLNRFNQGLGPRVLVTTPASLGLGANLQIASIIIFADLPWSHTQYVQAVSRIVRIGQKAVPMVYILAFVDSVDEHLARTLTRKQETFNEVVIARSVLDYLREKHA